MAWSDSLFRILGEIARGKTTLTNTPEESASQVPAPPAHLANRPEVKAMLQVAAGGLREQTGQIIPNEREVAGIFLQLMGQQ